MPSPRSRPPLPLEGYRPLPPRIKRILSSALTKATQKWGFGGLPKQGRGPRPITLAKVRALSDEETSK